jgi:hypothetical protein
MMSWLCLLICYVRSWSGILWHLNLWILVEIRRGFEVSDLGYISLGLVLYGVCDDLEKPWVVLPTKGIGPLGWEY